MSADNTKPKTTPAKVKKKKKSKRTPQGNAPFWVQLNNSGQRPKRNQPK